MYPQLSLLFMLYIKFYTSTRAFLSPQVGFYAPQLQACSADLMEAAHPQTPHPWRGSQGWKRVGFVRNLDALRRSSSTAMRGELVNPSVRSRGNWCLLLCLEKNKKKPNKPPPKRLWNHSGALGKINEEPKSDRSHPEPFGFPLQVDCSLLRELMASPGYT